MGSLPSQRYRPYCLVIRPFGDDCVSPLIYASDDQFDIIKRVLSIMIPNQAVFHDGQFTIAMNLITIVV
jgi:hypothetical protein